MKDELVRFGELVGKVGIEQAVPGIRELVGALHVERTRRFIDWLTSDDLHKSQAASQKIAILASRPEGETLLTHAIREILFGTESVSLAALALLASREVRGFDRFHQAAARAVRDLSNQDAIVFLRLLAAKQQMLVRHEGWRLASFLELDCLENAEWRAVVDIFATDQEQLVASVAELTRRRLLMPDTVTGRLGADKPRAFVGFTATSLRYYELLYRSLEIAEDGLFRHVVPAHPSEIENLWARRQNRTSEPPVT